MRPVHKVALVALMLLVAGAPQLFAQNVVPHEFEAGETARAADVNENFDALEDAATANALGVSDNAAGVTVNAEGVAANAAAVATQNANTGANATSITTNSVGIAGNAAAISSLNTTAGMNSAGISANAGGIATNAAGVELNANSTIGLAITVDANSVGMDANASDISLVQGDISLNADEIAALVTENEDLRAQLSALALPSPRFEDCGDGTVADHQEGLLWEKKIGPRAAQVDCDASACDDPHRVENTYSWCAGRSSAPCDDPSSPPDGSAYTDFLAKLNNASVGCYADHCDWRLPEIRELASILVGSGASGSSHEHQCTKFICIVDGFPDGGLDTMDSSYWSQTESEHTAPRTRAWGAHFEHGFVRDGDDKTVRHHVRATRNGSCNDSGALTTVPTIGSPATPGGSTTGMVGGAPFEPGGTTPGLVGGAPFQP